MATKHSEIDALKEIDQHLEQLTEEERQRIFNFIVSKYTISVNPKGTNNSNNASNGNNPNQSFSSDVTIKQFITTKKPQGFYEQIACLGYFLEKIQGLESFGAKDITKANTTARATKIPHTSLYLNNCF